MNEETETTGYRFEGPLADRKAKRTLDQMDGEIHHIELKVTTNKGGEE